MPTIITTSADVSRALRARRVAAGLTQRRLAASAAVSLTWLANIEAGCVPTQSKALRRIHAALDIAESNATNERRPAEGPGVSKVVQGDHDAGYQRL